MSPIRANAHLPDGRTRLLGIVGHPLDHSLSPTLHTAVLRMLDRNLIYVPFPVTEARLPRFFQEAPGIGVIGLNVTTPFKELAARWVRAEDEETRRTSMVNTIRFGADGPSGFGTDGAGILRWLQEAGLAGRPFGLLGFGATARSLTYRAISQGQVPGAVVTRRPEEVRACLADWGVDPPDLCSWDSVDAGGLLPGLSVWISTLPDHARVPPEAWWKSLSRRAVVLDMNYGPGRARVAEAARERGLRAADGTGPLLHQAALSLSAWIGEEVPVGLFYRALGRSSRALRPGRG